MTSGILAAVRAAFDERFGLDCAVCNKSLFYSRDADALASHLSKDSLFQDGPVFLVEQCSMLELLPRFAIIHAEEKRHLDSG